MPILKNQNKRNIKNRSDRGRKARKKNVFQLTHLW